MSFWIVDRKLKMKIYDTILETIGNTPIVRINKVVDKRNSFYAKLEFFNPGGSVKDRMAKHILEKAKKSGSFRDSIVENSSGNTGASIAMISAVKGYSCLITIPDKMSEEKVNLMKAYGSEVLVTRTDVAHDSPESYYSVASRVARERGAFYPDQYNNLDNIEAHYLSTGPEIWEQMDGQIDVFVAGVGTGGTISGVGKFLKEKNSKVKIIGVDPMGSVFYDYFKKGKVPEPHVYKVEGIGEDYLVKAVDFSVIDDIVQVDDRESFLMTRKLAREEGIFAGGSSGAAMVAAMKVAEKLDGMNIVVLFPDSGYRYLSKIYNDNWMRDNGFI